MFNTNKSGFVQQEKNPGVELPEQGKVTLEPTPWLSETLFATLPALEQWRVLQFGKLETIELDDLQKRVLQGPEPIQWHAKWNAPPKHDPVVFVVPPGQERMVPVVELAQFQPGILARDEALYRTTRKNQGLIFYGLLALYLLLLNSKTGVHVFLLTYYAFGAGSAHIEAWLALRKLSADPAQYLTAVGSKLRYACWQISHSRTPPIRTQALVSSWVIIAIAQVATAGLADQGRPDILAAGLIKSMVADQPWRLLTGPMLHGSLMHILMNGLSMLSLGVFIERSAHRSLVLPVWLLGALGGSLLSCLLLPAASIGASGGVMGAFGFLMVMAGKRRAQLPPDFLQGLVRGLMFMVLLGVLAWDIIDNAAHLGGLIAGGLLGLWVFKDAHGALPIKDSQALRMAGGLAELCVLGLSIFTLVKLFNH